MTKKTEQKHGEKDRTDQSVDAPKYTYSDSFHTPQYWPSRRTDTYYRIDGINRERRCRICQRRIARHIFGDEMQRRTAIDVHHTEPGHTDINGVKRRRCRSGIKIVVNRRATRPYRFNAGQGYWNRHIAAAIRRRRNHRWRSCILHINIK